MPMLGLYADGEVEESARAMCLARIGYLDGFACALVVLIIALTSPFTTWSR